MAFRFGLAQAGTYFVGTTILIAWLVQDPVHGAFALEMCVVYACVRVLTWRRQAAAVVASAGLACLPQVHATCVMDLPQVILLTVYGLANAPIKIAVWMHPRSRPEFIVDGMCDYGCLMRSIAAMALLAMAMTMVESRWAKPKPVPPTSQEDPLA